MVIIAVLFIIIMFMFMFAIVIKAADTADKMEREMKVKENNKKRKK